VGGLLLEKSNLASLALPTFSMSVRVSAELLKASIYFVALLRAILSRFADWFLLKLSATLKCNSCRTLLAGMGALSEKRPHNTRVSLGFIKAILDADVCGVLCAGRSPLYKTLQSITQLAGRGGLPNFTISPYRWRFANERERIHLLLNSIDDRLPFRKKSGLGSPELAPHFYKVSKGLVGLIMNYVEDAAAEAINDGSDCIKRDHLVYAATIRKEPGETFTPFLHEVDPERLDEEPVASKANSEKGKNRERTPKYMFNKAR
jgi:hypothetical protein